MQLPKALLDSLEGTKGFNKEAFERIHVSGDQVTSIRINPLKNLHADSYRDPTSLLRFARNDASNLHPDSYRDPTSNFQLSSIPWSQFGYYLSQRPSFTFDPLFHAGCYYVQEASSMFLEQALKQTVDLSSTLKVLDLSAAPGGKSTHIQSLISNDSLLVSNEVIRSRSNILKDNIIKWGCENVVVTNNDPKDFAKLESYFDVIVVDAPCSGSGLFRREPVAMKEWSLNSVALCSQRQQRILADVWPALKKEGILIYSTCSYSKEEDEKIMDWLIKEFTVRSLQLAVGEYPGIVETQSEHGGYGYRFFPDRIKGEGFFIACFQKQEGEAGIPGKTKSKATAITKNEMTKVENWVRNTTHQFIKYESTVYAWPDILVNDMNLILSYLRVVYSGVRAGELMRDKLVPDHALAMSRLVSDTIGQVNVNHEQAIRYLQRRDMQLKTENKSWQLVNYAGYSLGWINVLPGRINNYYPKELRILKDRDGV